MNLSAQFKEYLTSLSNPPSSITVKNYISDVNRFIRWIEAKLGCDFNPTDVNQNLIDKFKEESLNTYSASSIERSLSSLRKFFYYLKLDGKISHTPFELSTIKSEVPDPWKLKEFKNNLYVFGASNLTIKNYIIDVKQFLTWVDEVVKTDENWDASKIVNFSKITSGVIEEYKNRLLKEARLSPVSINRKLSSIRKFISWANAKGLIKPQPEIPNVKYQMSNFQTTTDPTLEIENLKLKTPNTKYSGFPPLRLFQKTKESATSAFDNTVTAPLAEALEKSDEIVWNLKGRPVFKQAQNLKLKTQNLKSSILDHKSFDVKNIKKEFYAPALISTANFPLHKKILHHARHSRPKWYKTYHSYAFASYLHFSILMLFISAMGYMVFNDFNSKKQTPIYAALPSAPPRILSFQGRLTDANDNPITKGTTLRMGIYSNQTASGAALLWQEIVSPTPDEDGIFSILLGNNNPIPQSLFAQNSGLWLGVTVEITEELKPRQQIATVAFAANAETLQGLPPITNTTATSNVVLALNSSGNLTIGGTANPIFQATGGTFTVSGRTLLLTTSSNGNIRLAPNGSGIIDIQKPIQNTTNSNALVPGSVTIEDIFSVIATSSGQAVLNLSQGSTGDLILASTSGNLRFKVDNAGNITANGSFNGISINSGTISSATWNGATIGAPYGGTGQSSYAVGDILYASSTTALAKLNIGTSAQCLVGGTTPSWGSCSTGTSGAWWSQAGGALYTDNTSVDFLVGGQSTSSAKFAILNINSARGSQVASLSGDIVLDKEGSLQTTNGQTLTIGGNTTGFINIDSGTGAVNIQDNTSINGNISTSGTTGLTFTSTGGINLAGGTLSDSADGVDINDELEVSGLATFNGGLTVPSGQTTTFANFTSDGGIFYGNATGVLQQVTAGSNIQCLLGGATPTFGSCNQSGLESHWGQANGALYPNNSTVDLLIGGQSTASAKFGFLNVNSGTPTASISGNSGNIATYLTGDGTLATINRNSLTIGNSSTYDTTGNVLINPNGTGNVGIGTASPTQLLDISGTSISPIYARAVNTSSGGSGFVVANSVGDNSGRFYWDNNNAKIVIGSITNNPVSFFVNNGEIARFDTSGNLGLNTTTPTAKLDVDGDASTSGSLVFNGSNKSIDILNGSRLDFQTSPGGDAGLAARMTILNNGNVGIGTTGPTTALEVSGQIKTNATTYSRIEHAVSGVNQWTTGTRDTNDYYIYRETGATNVLIPNGNVGIGTTTPTSFKLEMAGIIGPSIGSTYDLGSSSRRWATIYADTGNFTNISGTVTGGSTTSNDWLINSDNATNDTEDATLSFDRGIPATNAQFKWNSATKQISTNTSSFAILPDTTIAYSGTAALIVNQVQDQDIFSASAAGITKFTIDQNGSVTLAGTTLTASSLATFTTAATLGMASTTTLNLGSNATINSSATALNLQADGTPDVNIAGGSGATGCTVANSTGNLTCSGNITGATTGTAGYWTRTGTTLSPATAEDVLTISSNTAGSVFTATQTGSGYAGVFTGGNVGIGTTAPGAVLDVAGAAAGSGIRVYSAGTTYGGSITLRNTQASNYDWMTAVGGGDNVYVSGRGWFLRDLNAAATRLVVDTSGNVGIGTTAPGATLDVVGPVVGSGNTIRTSGDVTVGWGSTGSMLSFNSYSYATGDYIRNIATGSIGIFGGGTNAGASQLVVNNGSVGIGDSTPDAFLEVLGTTEQLRLTHTDGVDDTSFTVDTNGDLTLNVNATGGAGNLLLSDTDTFAIGGVAAGLEYNAISDSGGATSHALASDDDLFVEGDLEVDGSTYFDGTTYFSGIDTTFTQGSIVFAGASGVLAEDNTNFFWDDTNNRLGIGTTTPDEKLQVSGNLHVSSGIATIGDGIIAGQALRITAGTNTATAYGIMSSPVIGGTTSTVYGAYTFPNITANTPTNSYGFYAAMPYLSGGTITNNYGMRIENQGATGVTNAVGLYVDAQSGASSTNYAAIFAGGNVGIGTTTPGYTLDVAGNIHTSGILYLSQEDYNSQIVTDFTWRIGEASEDIILHTWSAGLGDYLLLRASAGQEEFTISDSQGFLFANGNVGIGDSTPDALLEVLGTTEQLRLTYTDGTVDSRFTVDSSGNLTIDNTGTKTTIADDLEITGGNITSAVTADSTLNVTGIFSANNAGTNDIAGTLNLSGNTLTSTGDLTITPAGGNILSSSPLNIGGAVATAYNFFADSTAGNANAVGDNDLYIEDDLEVDGTIYGDVVGSLDTTFTAGSVVFAGTSGVLAEDNTNFFWDDTNNRLGIGTTAPSSNLHVGGTNATLRIGSDNTSDGSAPDLQVITNDRIPTFKLTDSGVASSYITTSSNGFVFNTDTVNNYDFRTGASSQDTTPETSGTSRLYIKSDGNVGIGTTAPVNVLEAKGLFAAPSTSGSAQNGIARFSQTSGLGSLDIGFGDPYSWIQSRNSGNYATNYALALNPNGGNVGIGGIPGSAKLAVIGGGVTIGSTGFTADASLHINTAYGCCGRTTQIANSTGALNIMSGDAANWYSWGVASDNTWRINYGTSFGTTGLNINSSSNVGIGTIAPYAKFTSSPAAPDPGSGIDSFALTATGSYGGGIGLQDGTGNFGIWTNTTGDDSIIFGYGTSLGTLTETARIDQQGDMTLAGDLTISGGNITNAVTMDSTLTVTGTFDPNGAVTLPTTGISGAGSGSGLNADQLDGYDQSVFAGYTGGVADVHAIGGQNLYTFFSSASTPSNSPAGGTWVQGIQFPLAGNSTYRQLLATDSNTGSLYFESEGGGVWGGWRKIWDAGNDGAGSTLDADLLDGQSGSYYAPLANISGTTNYVAKFTGTNSVGNSVIYETGGNVGIGTTSPTVITNNTALSLYGGWYSSIDLGGNSLTKVLNLSVDGSGNGFIGTGTSGGGQNLYLQTASTTQMTILSGGNVGIGDSSPDMKLDVLGYGKFGDVDNDPAAYDNGLSITNAAATATSLFLWQNGVASAHLGFRASDTKLYLVNSTSDGLITNSNYMSLDTAGNAVISGDLDVNGGDITSANQITSDVDVSLPRLVLDSSSAGDNWTSQGAYVSIGESGALGSASMHLTYTGDGYGYSGAGTVTSGIPAGGYWRYLYNGQNIYTPGSVQIDGTFDPNGAITLPTTGISGAGSGSGLDADLWDGNQFATYLNQAVLTSSSPTFNALTLTTLSCTGCVDTTDILDGTILTGDISLDTILAVDIAAGAVATSEILDATILTGDIATDTILAGNIAAGAVATSEILDDTIVDADLAFNTGQHLTTASSPTFTGLTLSGTFDPNGAVTLPTTGISGAGSGSGLDADLLDGQHGSYYAANSKDYLPGLGNNVNYDIDRTAKRAGISHYSGYNAGTSRPTTYDYTLQVTDGSKGFEISADWISGSSTPLYVRSLRDCCQNWSTWSQIWTSTTDGAGSTLDADLLDGQSGSYYAPLANISGTTNYVAKFTGTNSVGNSIIQDNGTNVGVGQSPSYKLDVNGVIRGQGTTLSGDVLMIGNDSKLVDIDVANTAAIYGTSDTTIGSLKLGSGGGTISGYSGNIGIGTGSPVVRLEVQNTGGAPASSGTTSTALLRISPSATNSVMDIGTHTSSPFYGWIQQTDRTTLGATYPLALNPNGGNVGIGTTTPAAKLTVTGGLQEINVTTAAGAEVLDWPYAGLSIRRVDDYTSMTMLQFGHRDDSTYQTANAVWNFRLADNTGSKVTSDANTNLVLGGPGDLYLSPGGSEVYINSNVTWHAGNDGSGSGLDADLLDGANLSAAAGNSTVVQRNGSGYIYANYFNTTADVTAGAATHFAIQTSSDNFIRWQTPDNARTSLGLTAGGGGDIWVEKAGDTMTGALTNTLATGNSLVWDTSTLIVDATNNRVGVGTTTPKGALTVSGGGTFTNNHNVYDSDSVREGLTFNSYDLGPPNTWQRVSDIVAGQGNTASEIRFLTADWWTYSPVARMVIRPSGFVGIGAATPSGKLHVISDNAYNDGGGFRLQSNTTGNGNLLFASTSNAGDYAAVQSYKDTVGAKPLLLNGMGGVVIAGGFNSTTGLGADARFQVHGPAATDTAIGIWQNGVFSGKLGSLASSNNFYISNTSADGVMSAAHGITITSGYNVGIGQAPGYKLDVAGVIRGQGTTFSGDVLMVGNDSKIVDIDVADTMGVYSTSTPTQGSIKLGSGGGTISGYSGNIGIGTTAPSSNLHIYKANAALGFDAGLYIQTNPSDGTGERGGGITLQNLDVNTGGIYGIREGGGSWLGSLAFYTHTITAGNTFGTTFTEKMRITGAGNVGIGDTSPTNKLDVTGAIGISDTTVIDASRNLVNIGTITSGLINGQTISATANFTGTTNTVGLIYGNSKEMFNTGDSWLRINQANAFTSGIYAGTGILRTDGNFQVGASGASFNVTSAGAVTVASTLTVAGTFDPNGAITLPTTGISGAGSGSGLDADLIDGISSAGFGRSFGTLTFASSTTTANFITDLSTQGLLGYGLSSAKATWSYAGNSDITDTGFGDFELAGTSLLTWNDGSYRTILAIRPTTGSGGGQVLIYNDQGSGYSPGWRQIWTSTTDGAGSGLDADLLDGQSGSYYAPLGNISGTTNYVAKFTGTNSVGNSIIQDNGTNVGVGVSPSYKLEVAGEIGSIGNNRGFRVASSQGDNTNAAPWYGLGNSNLTLSGATGTAVQLAGYYGLNLQTAGGQMVVNQGGNVGIGTTNPLAQLQVDQSSNTEPAGLFINGGGTGEGVRIKAGASGNYAILDAALYDGTSRFYVRGDGNVGIGTAAPGYKLENTGNLNNQGQAWYSYGNTSAAGYSWVNAALTTNSIEIVNGNSVVTNTSPTLAFHRYGSGGPQFRLDPAGTNVLYLESANASSARSGSAPGGGYFASLNLTTSDANGIYVNTNKVFHAGNDGTGSTLDADLIDGITSTNLFNNMGDAHATRTSFDATNPSYGYGTRFVQGSTNGPGTNGATQYYSEYIGLGSDLPSTGANSYGMQIAIPRNVTLPYVSVRYNENNSLGAWQKISAGYADSAGDLSCTNCIGPTEITDLTLGTDTAGNYVGTITGSGTITSSGATSGEGIAHTLSVTADSIGDTQLAYDTGQALTTASSPTFANVFWGTGAQRVETWDDLTNRNESGFYETSTATTGENWPETAGWYHLLNVQHNNGANNYAMQIASDFYTQDSLYFRATNGSGATAWSEIWTSSSDGSGSTLDADLWDGNQFATYLNQPVLTSSNVTFGTINSGALTSTGDVTGKSLIVSGGGSYVAGAIYSDANYGMIFRAKQAAPAVSQYLWVNSAGTATMSIDNSNNLTVSGGSVTATSFSGAGTGLTGTAASLNIGGSSGTVDGIDSTQIVYGSNAARSQGGASISPNTPFNDYGSGFIDVWSGANMPAGTTHIQGFSARHTNLSSNWGIQVAGQYNQGGTIFTRGVDAGTWSSWYKIWSEANDGAGSTLDADLLDNYNLDFASTVSTVVGRDGSGDINTRLFRSEYDSTNGTIGYIMTQIDTASNNYIRPSTPAQLVTGLGLEAGGSRDIWVEKAGDTMTGALTNTLATGNSLVWDTDTLIVDATNDRVGIGKTAPAYTLDVANSIRVGSTTPAHVSMTGGDLYVSDSMEINDQLYMNDAHFFTVANTSSDCDDTTPDAGTSWLCIDVDNDGTSALRINANGAFYTAGSQNPSGNPDVAETIRVVDASIESGDIVSAEDYDINEENIYQRAIATKTNYPYANNIVGAITEGAGVLIGTKTMNSATGMQDNERGLTIAGRIPVKVSTINGEVKVGDSITSSEIPGIGMKATNAGKVLGTVMTDYIDNDSTQSAKLINGNWETRNQICQNGESNCYNYQKVLVLINPSFDDPDVQLASTGYLTLAPTIDNDFEVKRNTGETVQRIGAFSDLVVARIKSGYLETGKLLVTGSASVKNLTTETLASTIGNFSQLSTDSIVIGSENISIAGQNIRDFIAGIVDERISNQQLTINNQPSAKADIISPLSSKDLTIKLPDSDSSFIIRDSSGSAVASIDALGNASLSGELKSNSIQTGDATISGTLRATRIIADQIEGLNIQASTVSANYITNNYYSATPSASENSQSSTSSASFNNLTVMSATFEQGLIAYGTASFYEASVADRLFVGSRLSLADTSINVLGGNLELQPLKQGGVAFVGGQVEIDVDGNLRVDGNAYFAKDVDIKGKLLASFVSPLPGRDFVLELGRRDNESESENHDSSFIIRDSSASALLSVNNKGDLNASGAGTFNKLNLSFVNKALAISPTEVIATGSAGTADIQPNREELTVRNTLVTEDSLIYITTKTSTQSESVYLLRQVPGKSFTVGISNSINKKVPFNWIIIN